MIRPSLALALAFLSISPAAGQDADWKARIMGEDVNNVKAPEKPYLHLDLGCGARMILPAKLPSHAELAKAGVDYTYYFENVRDNPDYLAHVSRQLAPDLSLTLSDAEKTAIFAKTSLSFTLSRETMIDGHKMREVVNRLRAKENTKAEIRAALKTTRSPEEIKELRRAVKRALAGRDAPENPRALTIKDRVQQKVVAKQLLRSVFVWDFYNAIRAAQPGADAEKRARLDEAERVLNLALTNVMESDMTVGLALDTLFISHIPEKPCSP